MLQIVKSVIQLFSKQLIGISYKADLFLVKISSQFTACFKKRLKMSIINIMAIAEHASEKPIKVTNVSNPKISLKHAFYHH